MHGETDASISTGRTFDQRPQLVGGQGRVRALCQLVAERLDVVVLVVPMQPPFLHPAAAVDVEVFRPRRGKIEEPYELQVALPEADQVVVIDPHDMALARHGREPNGQVVKDRGGIGNPRLGGLALVR